MGTTIDKLNKVQETKEAIKQAIINKGVEIPDGTIFADYPNKISEITSGEGGGDSTTYENPNFYEIRTNGGTDYKGLFRDYNGTSLDIGNWDTSNVTDMNNMFADCRSLETLNLSNWDMTNVRDTNWMFGECNRLHTLRLDNCNEGTIRKIIESDWFPTGEIWDYEGTRQIFVKEENVANLVTPNGWEFVDAVTGEVIVQEEPEFYIPGYYRDRDIEEATTMVTSEHDNLSGMFSGCGNLRTINGINEWDTSNVTDMEIMFNECRSLESLDLSSFNTSNVENMYDMFARCENLRELNMSNFDMSSVTSTNYMLVDCPKLHTLRLDNCSNDTISKIITSRSFPTGEAEDYEGTRKIYCKQSNVTGLTAPSGWVFEYVTEGDEE